MIVSANSVNECYLLQPVLSVKHKGILEGLASVVQLKQKLEMFQLLFDQSKEKCGNLESKVKRDHLQDLILNNQDKIEVLIEKLRAHERGLSELALLEESLENNYFTEHDGLIREVEKFKKRFHQLQDEIYNFLEMCPYPQMI